MTSEAVGHSWPPIAATAYDHGPLTTAEQGALGRVLEARGGWTQHMSRTLERLTQPIHDLVYTLETNPETARETRNVVIRVLAREMHARQTVFWRWSDQEWKESITPCAQAFAQRYGKSVTPARKYVIALAYLFCEFTDYPILRSIPRLPLAQAIFGQEAVERAVEQVRQQLQDWGYGATAATLRTLVCDLLLLHRSPRLEGLSTSLIEQVYQEQTPLLKPMVVQISRALAAQNIIPHPLAPSEWRLPPIQRRLVGSTTGSRQPLEPVIWDQLLEAVLTLSEQDLPHSGRKPVPLYPLEMIRALAITWFLSGERAKEVCHLRVGCLQRRPVEEESGSSLLLIHYHHLPPSLKPVPDAVAEAISAWEAVRPPQQPATDDEREAHIHFLFSFRGKPLRVPYLETTLLPLLCRKAGIESSDARSKITPLCIFLTSRDRGRNRNPPPSIGK